MRDYRVAVWSVQRQSDSNTVSGVVSGVMLPKCAYARGIRPRVTFYRDGNGRKIDVLVEQGGRVAWAAEVKTPSTYSPKWFRSLDAIGDLLGVDPAHRTVTCGLDAGFEIGHGRVVPIVDLPGMVFGFRPRLA